jgi:hypothetical protein
MEKFNLKKLNDMEVKKSYPFKIPDILAASHNNAGIIRA